MWDWLNVSPEEEKELTAFRDGVRKVLEGGTLGQGGRPEGSTNQKTEELRRTLAEVVAAYPDLTPQKLLNSWHLTKFKALHVAFKKKPGRATLYRLWPKEIVSQSERKQVS